MRALPKSVVVFLMLSLTAFSKTVAYAKSSASNILVFGDSGTGWEKQMIVAEKMYETCYPDWINAKGIGKCDFALVLGDNFYINGVANENDPQFDSKFGDPYGPLLFDKYVILGNHDWGNIDGSFRTGLSTRFKDSIKANALSQLKFNKYGWKISTVDPQKSAVYGPIARKNIDFFTLDTTVYNTTRDGHRPQELWVKKALEDNFKNSPERWRVLVLHHPVYTFGAHGGSEITDSLQESLLPTLCKYVDLIIAGHNHSTELNTIQCGDDKNLIYQLVTGGAGWDFHATWLKNTTAQIDLSDGTSYAVKLVTKKPADDSSDSSDVLFRITGISYARVVIGGEKNKAKIQLYDANSKTSHKDPLEISVSKRSKH